ncbi:MAG: hypothetical protein EOS85_32975, partial [Mesorhizobium sp.]
MTSLLTAAPSYCARFGVAVLLAALADFFFYGQPVGITLFLFGITLAAAAGRPAKAQRRPSPPAR